MTLFDNFQNNVIFQTWKKAKLMLEMPFLFNFKVLNYQGSSYQSPFLPNAKKKYFWHKKKTSFGENRRQNNFGERGGSVVECRTPEREVEGSKPTAAVLCPWARHFTPRKYWLIKLEAVAPSRHDWKIVDWDVKLQHKQTNKTNKTISTHKKNQIALINKLECDIPVIITLIP